MFNNGKIKEGIDQLQFDQELIIHSVHRIEDMLIAMNHKPVEQPKKKKRKYVKSGKYTRAAKAKRAATIIY